MESNKKLIMIIAGEDAGDLHASFLARALRERNPDLQLTGLGGPQMAAAGVTLIHDLTKIAVVGFFEVLKHYGKIRKIFYDTLAHIKQAEPEAVILVDYPGFNLRLAKKIKRIKKLKTKVIYYISPQVWAWKKNRIKDIRKYIDKMLVIFDFEQKFYAKNHVEAVFVGHPLIEEITVSQAKEDVLASISLQPYKYTIGLLPGSREKEIQKLFPTMLKSVYLIQQEFPMVQFLVKKAPSIEKALLEKYILASRANVVIADKDHYDVINACDTCIVASGTATLEVGILQKPMVIVYKTNFFTWLLAKMFVKIPHIGLVNVIAGHKLVPELIQFDATPENITKEIKIYIENEDLASNVRLALAGIKNSLGRTSASDTAVGVIIDML